MQVHTLEVPVCGVPEPFGAGAIKWLVAEPIQLVATAGLPIRRSKPVISVSPHFHITEAADIESMLNVAAVIECSSSRVKLARCGTEPDRLAVSQINAPVQAADG